MKPLMRYVSTLSQLWDGPVRKESQINSHLQQIWLIGGIQDLYLLVILSLLQPRHGKSHLLVDIFNVPSVGR